MTDHLQAYLVGGAVRDQLLGLPVGDRDWVVVGATREEMIALGYTQVGRDFPVFLHPDSHEEYALARTERKHGSGHRGFTVHAAPDVTLEEDLRRRDLTINAIALDHQGNLIDPFGGQKDLTAQCLRHVSPAFKEDPLRVFRLARFAAQLPNFQVAPETLALSQEMVAQGELQTLSAERVWQEFDKALDAQAPKRFFEVLSACRGLDDWCQELVGLDIEFATIEARMRFAELLDNEDAFRSLAARLKAPNLYLQSALDRLRCSGVLLRWRDVGAAELNSVLDYLKVAHQATRAVWVMASWQQPPGEIAAFTELCAGYAKVAPHPVPPPGPEYGQALQQARIIWLDQIRAR